MHLGLSRKASRGDNFELPSFIDVRRTTLSEFAVRTPSKSPETARSQRCNRR